MRKNRLFCNECSVLTHSKRFLMFGRQGQEKDRNLIPHCKFGKLFWNSSSLSYNYSSRLSKFKQMLVNVSKVRLGMLPWHLCSSATCLELATGGKLTLGVRAYGEEKNLGLLGFFSDFVFVKLSKDINKY